MSVVQTDLTAPVARLTLNRPESFNALNDEILLKLRDALGEAAERKDIRAVVLTGAGNAFCSGGDLKYLQAAGDEASHAVYHLAGVFHACVLTMRRMSKPVIAALNGVAAGGGFSLALACDLRVMNREARLRLAYTNSGLSIDGGGTWTLPRLVGFSRALEIALADPMMSAEHAHQIGLVHRLAPPDEVVESAVAWGEELSSLSPDSVRNAKDLLYSSMSRPLETQLDDERLRLASILASPNGTEALAAFTEKRKPTWKS